MDTSSDTLSLAVRPTTPSADNDTFETECNIYKEWRRTSKGFLITGYEGIPQNLVLNILGVILMVLLYSVIRKKAWNYGRIALMNDPKMAHICYDSAHEIQQKQLKARARQKALALRQAAKVASTTSEEGPSDNNNSVENPPAEEEESPPRPTHRGKVMRDTGFFTWIKITFKLTDDQFLEKSGSDAVQYLSYQRHLIFLAALVTLASLIVVLPLNLQGSKDYDATPDITVFSQSTIFNLSNDSKLLWIHEMLAISILILSIIVMRHFSRNVKFMEEDLTIKRTIIVANITKNQCFEDRVRGHFTSLYPECEVEEVTFAYDVKNLVESEDKVIGVEASRMYWEEIVLLSDKRPTMRPYACGYSCWCFCCCCKKTDALHYYTQLERKHRKQSDIERKRAINKPLGMAFVTFSSMATAEKAVRDYRLSARFFKQTPVSPYSRRLRTKDWLITYAPLPDDLYWENLSITYKAWYLKALLVNITLVLVVCFYSTPVFLLNALNLHLDIKIQGDINAVTEPGSSGTLNGILRDTVPTFMLWLAAVTLPSIVSFSDRFIGFWTKTAENRSKMIKTFTFLLFMVIILPSLGQTSVSSFFQNQEVRWRCIFSPTNGSFFVNYVITSCFLGTVSELLRLPELCVYAFKLCYAKSKADISGIRRSVLWDFQLGSQYAWMMLIFAIFILFSLVCPVITIFGFVYLLFKHFVDRYNIYFAYAPCKVDKSVHGTAINFVVVCTFLQQLILVAYTNSTSNMGPFSFHNPEGQRINKPLQAFTILGFCITASLFIGQVFFNMCANFSPIFYNKLSGKETETGNRSHKSSDTSLPPTRISSVESDDLVTTLSPQRMNSPKISPTTSEHVEISIVRETVDATTETEHRHAHSRHPVPHKASNKNGVSS